MPPVPPTRSGLQVVDTTGHADTATLTVFFKTSVAITGEFHAVEGTADMISLTFVRTTNDTSQYLDVIYDVNYVAVNGPAASPSDLVNPNDLTGTIRIAAGQFASAPIVLTAKADNVGDGIENLQVVIQPTSDYVPVSGPTTLTKNNNVEGVAFATLQILDGVTPYAKNDQITTRDDNRSLSPANPGIAVNDVDQGTLGDCYFMAAVAALGRRTGV